MSGARYRPWPDGSRIAARQDGFLDNSFLVDQLEQRMCAAVANYRHPAPWGCLLGLLRSRPEQR